MERDIVMTGIGGQGVQMAATILARGAVASGKHVSMMGVYGGEMRGGPSGSTVIIGDGPISAPPKLSVAWSIIVFHPKFWHMVESQARAQTLVVCNSDLAASEHDGAPYRVVRVPATSIARELGNEAVAAMVMAGAYLRVTGLVDVEAVKQAMADSIPKYRAARIAENARAIDAGYALDLAREHAA